MDRRAFLGVVAGAGLAGLGIPTCSRGGTANPEGAGLDRIGLQLYTVRDRMRQDVPVTLQAVAEIGYREVETAGLFDLTPERFRAALDRAGLVSPAGHVAIEAVRKHPGALLAGARTLGQRWLVVPWVAEEERTLAGYRGLAGDLNRFAAAAREEGLRVAYHNQDFEFLPLEDGPTGYAVLLAETDPALVDMELDLFWAVKAGRDPVALFTGHPGRFPLCHVKDMTDIHGAQEMVAVGEGEIGFARIFGHSEQAGLRHYFVEHDNPRDSLASIRASYAHLRRLSP